MSLSEPVLYWLSTVLSSQDITQTQLAGDASARRYFRIYSAEQSYVLMQWESFKEDEYPFLTVQKHFQDCGVRVPKIIALNSVLGLLLLEDLGDLTLERKFWEGLNESSSELFYYQTLDELIKIHHLATHSKHISFASQNKFDTAKFSWELNYTKEHLLQNLLNIRLNDASITELQNIFIDISQTLASKSDFITHRDFHSRNVMLKRDQVCIIDFQDARFGPIQYDLVSLFKDSYVQISADYEQKLLNYYLEKSHYSNSAQFSLESFMSDYELQTIQRCFKACGSFASFYNNRADTRYLKYLPNTLKKVIHSLQYFSKYNLLAKILIDSGALEKNYESIS